MRSFLAILTLVTSVFIGGFCLGHSAGVMSGSDQAHQQLAEPAAELVSRVKLTRYDLEQLLLHPKELERLAGAINSHSTGARDSAVATRK